MSKINYERPSLKLKNSFLKSMKLQDIGYGRDICQDKPDYATQPQNIIDQFGDQNIEINVDQLISAFLLFNKSWTAQKLNLFRDANAVSTKKTKIILEDSKLLEERLDTLALKLRPLIGKLLINELNSHNQKNQNIILWHTHLTKHLKVKYNVALQEDALEHLYDFCFGYFYKKVVGQAKK